MNKLEDLRERKKKNLLGGGEKRIEAQHAKGKLTALLEEAAGGKILGHDLYLCLRQKASVWGIEEEYISSAALDDLECAWCCTEGFLAAAPSDSVSVLCVFDSEEVGSASVQGAASDLLELTLARICQCFGWSLPQLLAQSFLVSADNAHAIHPNHPEFADPSNAPVPGGGVVLKFNANQRYCTDGVAAAVFRSVCGKANVPVQSYCNRADLPGGSTLGNISLAHVSIPTADIGLAQLAMHSCYETASVKDVAYLIDAMAAFYATGLKKDGEQLILV
jgi:aspartyl aminopeptidase